VVVWRLDRLGRSLRHLIDVFADLDARGIAVVSLTENLDTTTPGGRLVFHVFGALAEFERDLIRERTMAGLAAARARGRVGGRRPALSPKQVEVARNLYAGGEQTVSEIAKIVGVSRATVYRHLGMRQPTHPVASE
jgi:DNA invertase Pin-like site-specific DNA recombinase